MHRAGTGTLAGSVLHSRAARVAATWRRRRQRSPRIAKALYKWLAFAIAAGAAAGKGWDLWLILFNLQVAATWRRLAAALRWAGGSSGASCCAAWTRRGRRAACPCARGPRACRAGGPRPAAPCAAHAAAGAGPSRHAARRQHATMQLAGAGGRRRDVGAQWWALPAACGRVGMGVQAARPATCGGSLRRGPCHAQAPSAREPPPRSPARPAGEM